MRKVIDRGKRSNTLSEVKAVKNISKNLQSSLGMSHMKKDVLPSHNLQDHAYEYQNPFRLKEDNPSQRNCQSQLSHPRLSHIEQECQYSSIQGKTQIQQNLNEDLQYLCFPYDVVSNSMLHMNPQSWHAINDSSRVTHIGE